MNLKKIVPFSLCLCDTSISLLSISVPSSAHRKNRGQSIRHTYFPRSVKTVTAPVRLLVVFTGHEKAAVFHPDVCMYVYLELTSGTFEQWEPRAIQTIRHLHPACMEREINSVRRRCSCIRELHSNERNLYRNAFLTLYRPAIFPIYDHGRRMAGTSLWK